MLRRMMTGVRSAGSPRQNDCQISRPLARRGGGTFSQPALAKSQLFASSTAAMASPGSTPATNRWPTETFIITA